MHTSEIDMAKSVEPADIDTFIDNAAWEIRSTYHTVLKASPGAAIFGRDMLLDIPFVAAISRALPKFSNLFPVS